MVKGKIQELIRASGDSFATQINKNTKNLLEVAESSIKGDALKPFITENLVDPYEGWMICKRKGIRKRVE